MSNKIKRNTAGLLIRPGGKLSGILTILLGCMFVSSVAAQQPTSSGDEADAESEGTLEEVIVTGSMIRGVDPVGSQIITVDKSAIEASGMQSVADILATIPQLNTFGTTPVPGGTPGGAPLPNTPPALRGLPASATLSLVNGHRLPGLGVISTFADPSYIPVAAIERVDVLAEGASSIYGSDAVAGVINVILRKDFDGVDLQASYGTASGYDETNISGVFGKTWDTGSILIGGQIFTNDNLMGGSRDYVKSNFSNVGGVDGRSLNALMPNVTVAGQNFHYNGSVFTPGFEAYDPLLETNLIPKSSRKSAVLNFNQRLGDRIVLFGDAQWGEIKNSGESPASTANFTITDVNPYFKSPIEGATSAAILYRFDREFGPNNGGYSDPSYTSIYFGADIGIAGDWAAKVYGGYNKGVVNSKPGSRQLLYNVDAMNTALASSDPATAFDPFDAQTSEATLAAISSGASGSKSEQTITQFVAQVDGSIMELSAGNMRFAGGAEYREETYDGLIVQGTVAAPKYSHSINDRKVTSVFSELYVPIFSDSNAVTGIRDLTLSLAVRYDDYSDFGSTTNPKVSLDWSPVESLMFKANYSESFRAPSLAVNATPNPQLFAAD